MDTPVLQPRQQTLLRLGSVSFLNAKPLIYELDEADDLDLTLDVPSRLLDGLKEHRFDVALLPVIDYQRLDGLRLLTSGAIGCNGPTLTVRLFGKKPFDQTAVVACDTDSHTSVALARILFAEKYGLWPRFIPLDATETAAKIPDDAVRLLIGDKVVCDEPVGFDHQLDLGQAWKSLTGLPFIFACWMARPGTTLGDLPNRLVRAKRLGLANVESILVRHAIPRGWPAETARQYLLEYLDFDVTPDGLKAIELFHQLAYQHGVLQAPPRKLEIYSTTDGQDRPPR